MRWLVLCGIVFFAACERPCSPSTCTGCCSAGECVAGTARVACGERGAECSVCRGTEQCAAAKCEALVAQDAGVVDAGPVTCACATSCCLPDGSCSPNNSIEACGPTGAFCGTCDADQRCEAGTCVAAACAGCLDPLGRCFDGREDRTCGSGGSVCQTCAADQRCVNGACAYVSCGPDNCRFGCCMPDKRCETSPGLMACGLNGDACQACTSAQQCLAGYCQ